MLNPLLYSAAAVASLLLVLTGTALQSASDDVSPHDRTTPSDTASVVTITYVKKPWYAWRTRIVKKFKESIPQYAAIAGLLQKNYHLSESRETFGGIYLWRNEADAKAWFTPVWFERVRKTYGAEGRVDYYEIVRSREIAPSETSGQYWSVLQLDKPVSFTDAPGLLRITEIKHDSQYGTVTLWKSKEAAEKFFSQRHAGTLTYFDTPVLIDKLK